MANFRLSNAGRIRIVVGVGAISLGWMEYITPSTSAKWEWLRRLAIQTLGETGYVAVLMLIGLVFIAWGIVEAIFLKREKQ